MDTGNPAMFNRYSYTWNDPVNLVDPNGELPIVDDIKHIQTIRKEQSQKFPGRDGANDAMRHATTTKRIAEETIFGGTGAAMLGVANEAKGAIIPNAGGETNTPTQSLMDILNNQDGIDAAAEGREIDPKNLVKIENGDVLVPVEGPGKFFNTEQTQEVMEPVLDDIEN